MLAEAHAVAVALSPPAREDDARALPADVRLTGAEALPALCEGVGAPPLPLELPDSLREAAAEAVAEPDAEPAVSLAVAPALNAGVAVSLRGAEGEKEIAGEHEGDALGGGDTEPPS